MRAPQRLRAISLTVLVAVVPPMRAASPVGDWEAVRDLDEGRRIRAVLPVDGVPRKHQVLKGRFASATDAQLTIVTSDGGTETFPRGRIRQVRVRVPFLSRKAGWIGGLGLAGPYSIAVGCLSGIGGFFAGFFLGIVLAYPAFAAANPTRAVYKVPAIGGAAGVRQPRGTRDSPAGDETSPSTLQRNPDRDER